MEPGEELENWGPGHVPLADPCPFCGETATHENCPVVSTPYMEWTEPRPDMGEPGGYEPEPEDDRPIPF